MFWAAKMIILYKIILSNRPIFKSMILKISPAEGSVQGNSVKDFGRPTVIFNC